jgi:predicted nucleic acid-binding protein
VEAAAARHNRPRVRLDAKLSSTGKAVGDDDLVIAATAVWLDYRVATRDVRSFSAVKGRVVVRW